MNDTLRTMGSNLDFFKSKGYTSLDLLGEAEKTGRFSDCAALLEERLQRKYKKWIDEEIFADHVKGDDEMNDRQYCYELVKFERKLERYSHKIQ